MKYDGNVDLSNRNSSQVFAVEMVGGNKRVLEFGCASGFVSRVLRDRGCRVVGIEIDPEFASQAKEFCEDVLVGNAEEMDLESMLAGQVFDAAVFGDVLEHMSDPLAMLRRVRQWLVPEGYVVASLPNVAHGAVRLALLDGHFQYTREGLLDETHLRFFTLDTIKDLFHEAGFAVLETRRTHVGIFESEIPLDRANYDDGLLARIEADPDAETYQFVVKAVVDNALSAAELVHEREEVQRVAILRLEGELGQAVARVEALEATLEQERSARAADQTVTAGLRQEADVLRAGLAARDDAIAHY
ncbi:MAG: methyltransferase domain-containing protein, partial [Acidimicrobiia bacterium]|nr:methyltransferase domain-containing protein [Acidimicrobiia bacterium]